MADTQIDELRLDITVEDKTSGESSSKKVRSLASAISRLNKVVSNVDVKQLEMNFGQITSAIQPFLTSINSCSQVINSLSNVISNKSIAMQELNKAIDKTTTATLKLTNANLKLNTSYKGQFRRELSRNIEKMPAVNMQMSKEAQEYFKNLTTSVKKANTHLDKLLKSFARIALYRAVRRTIQEITQAFIGSANAIAQYDTEFRTTMGNLQSSINIAKASIGVALYQALIVLEPVITKIAIGIANLANGISKVIANMRGESRYLKINTEYWKDYQAAVQGTLLSFDTFNTLSLKQDYNPSEMFKEANDALNKNNFSDIETRLNKIFTIIQKIANVFKDLEAPINSVLDTTLNIIAAIANSKILNFFVDLISSIVRTLDEAGLLEGVIIGIGVSIIGLKLNGFISSIKQVIDVLKMQRMQMKLTEEELTIYKKGINGLTIAASTLGFTLGFKLGETILGQLEGQSKQIVSGIFMIVGAIGALTAAIMAYKGVTNPVAMGAAMAAVAVGITGITAHFNDIKSNAKTYANGGMFDGAGTMYALAGESGAEVVAQGSAGTGVLNVDQFADAMVSALVRYGAARDTSNGTTIVLDGNKVGQLVASNVGFRNEANRRNAGLNWK